MFDKFVLLPKIREKYLIFLAKIFQKHCICILNIRKVFDFGPNKPKSIGFLCNTFEKFRTCAQNLGKIYVFDPKHSKSIWWRSNDFEKCWISMESCIRKTSYLFSKHLKSISSWPKTFEKYRISTQTIWKVSDYCAKHLANIKALRKIFEKCRLCMQEFQIYLVFVQKVCKVSSCSLWRIFLYFQNIQKISKSYI